MRHELPLGHSGLSIESPDRTESYVNFSLVAEAPLPHSLAPIPTRAFPDHGLDTLSPLFLGTSSPALAALREAVGRYVSCSLLSVGIGLPRRSGQRRRTRGPLGEAGDEAIRRGDQPSVTKRDGNTQGMTECSLRDPPAA